MRLYWTAIHAIPFVRLLGHCRPRRLNFGLHGIEVEACPLLHRRKLDRGHGQLPNLLLDEYEAPEFIFEPIKVLLRTVLRTAIGPACALEWIEA